MEFIIYLFLVIQNRHKTNFECFRIKQRKHDLNIKTPATKCKLKFNFSPLGNGYRSWAPNPRKACPKVFPKVLLKLVQICGILGFEAGGESSARTLAAGGGNCCRKRRRMSLLNRMAAAAADQEICRSSKLKSFEGGEKSRTKE